MQKGARDEFDQLEQRVLGPLWDKFRELAKKHQLPDSLPPVLLTVPGNHDLRRPGDDIDELLKPAFTLLEPELFPKIADELFNDADSPYRQIIDTAFANDVTWTGRQPRGQDHPICTSRFPGDFSTTFELPEGYRVGVLGLNTTFLQLAAGGYQGRLAWDVRQFHAVCEEGRCMPRRCPSAGMSCGSHRRLGPARINRQDA